MIRARQRVRGSMRARLVAMAEVMAAARVAVAGATAAVAAAHTRVLLCTFTAALRPKRLLEMYFYGSGADA